MALGAQTSHKIRPSGRSMGLVFSYFERLSQQRRPQEQQPGEDGIQFANRVRELICQTAGIKPVPWDGMLKYYRPSPRICEKRRAEIASGLVQLLPPGKKGE